MAFFTKQPTREIVDEVMEDTYQLVCSTMGPEGRLIVIQFGEGSKATKDGVTVVKSISYDTPERSIVARMITEASIQTDKSCGDGTTTTVFLTNWLYRSFKDRFTFINQRHLDKLIKEAIQMIKDRIHYVQDVNDDVLRMLAMTTSNNDSRIVDTVLDIYRNSKAEPDITVIEGSSQDDIIESVEGINISGGFAHPSFSFQGTGNPLKVDRKFIPIVVDKDITAHSSSAKASATFDALRDLSAETGECIVLFCRSMDNDFCNQIQIANRQLVTGQNKGGIIVVSIDAQGSVGSGIMSDVAMLFNTTPVAAFDSELMDFDTRCDTEFVITPRNIQIGKLDDVLRDKIEKHVEQIDETIRNLGAAQNDSVVARILRRRKRSLVGGQVKIFVGGDVQSDIRERMDRFTDVIEAVKSALEGGVIPGCGSVLLNVGYDLYKRHPGDEIAATLCEVFSQQYCHLMGESLCPVTEPDYEDQINNVIYTNLATGETGEDPADLGIYDTAEALLNALRAGYKTSTLLINLSGILLGNNLTKKEFKIG